MTLIVRGAMSHLSGGLGGVGGGLISLTIFLMASLLPASAGATTASWAVEPASWDFGVRVPGSEGAADRHTFTLRNTGEAELSPGLVLLGGEAEDGFELHGHTCHSMLAHGEGCTITVQFEPTRTGPTGATLEVDEVHSTVPPATASLSGIGGGPSVAFSPSALDFGTTTVGTPPPAPQTVTVTNTGITDLLISAIEIRMIAGDGISGPAGMSPFQLSGGSCMSGASIAPGVSCTATVAYRWLSEYSRDKDHLLLQDNAFDSPQGIPLGGASWPEGPRMPPPPPPEGPRATFGRHPAKRTASHRATFTFSGNEATGGFECKLDRGLFAPCTSPKRFRSLKPGKHAFWVRPLGKSPGIASKGRASSFRWRISATAK